MTDAGVKGVNPREERKEKLRFKMAGTTRGRIGEFCTGLEDYPAKITVLILEETRAIGRASRVE